ncbi:MAG: hypothetical protein R2795_02380 [Saprospiraceae bacterium]
MNRRFNILLSPLLAAYLMVVSIGIPLEKVYCACMGIERIVLFGQEATGGCHYQPSPDTDKACCSNPSDTCPVQQSSVCCQPSSLAAGTACHTEAGLDGNCMESEPILLQFHASFLPADPLLLAIVWPCSAAVLTEPYDWFTNTLPSRAPLPMYRPDPPLGNNGRFMRVLYQSFLC